MPAPANLAAIVSDERFGSLPPEKQRGLAAQAEPRLGGLPPDQQDAFIQQLRSADHFDLTEKRYGLPSGTLRAMAHIESSGNPRAVSPTGVRGLMQITRKTGKPYGLTESNWHNPVLQIDIAGQIVRDNLARAKGDLNKALAMYGDPNDKTYAQKIRSRMGAMAAAAAPQPTGGGFFGPQEAGAATEAPTPTRNITRVGGGGLVRPPATPGFGTIQEPPSLTKQAVQGAVPAVLATGAQLVAGAALGPEAGILMRSATEAAAGIVGGLLGREGVATLSGERAARLPSRDELTEETVTNVLPVAAGHLLRGTLALTKPELRAAFGSVAPKIAQSADPAVIGTAAMRVADEALTSVEKHEVKLYGRVRSAIADKAIFFPRAVADPARRALDDVGSFGLSPSQQTRVTKALRRMVELADAREGTPITGAELDDFRRELQPFVTKFERRGAPMRPEQSALDQTYHQVKREIHGLVRGADSEQLLEHADDYYIHHVKPMRAARAVIARGQIEPQSIVETLTSPKHEAKFAAFLKRTQHRNPEFARRLVAARFSRLVTGATDTVTGRFDPLEFERAWNRMPASTQSLLTKAPSELSEFVGHLKAARVKTMRQLKPAQTAVRGASAIAAVTGGLKALHDGDVSLGTMMLVGSPAAGYFLSKHLADPAAIKLMNRAYRAAAAGASRSAVARFSAQATARISYDVLREGLKADDDAVTGDDQAP